jgi:hypothetical protein
MPNQSGRLEAMAHTELQTVGRSGSKPGPNIAESWYQGRLRDDSVQGGAGWYFSPFPSTSGWCLVHARMSFFKANINQAGSVLQKKPIAQRTFRIGYDISGTAPRLPSLLVIESPIHTMSTCCIPRTETVVVGGFELPAGFGGTTRDKMGCWTRAD